MKKRGHGGRGRTLAAVALGLSLAVSAAGLGLAFAEEPAADGAVEYVQHAPQPEGGERIADFSDLDSGLFPDTYTNTNVLNAGNRGCNSCHDDLWQTASGVMATDAERTMSAGGHIDADRWSHYGRKGTILDCIGCHSGRTQNTGSYLGDAIHTIHYSSDAFNAVNTNCWTCHAVRTDEMYTDTNDYDLVLWEEQMYNIDLGGYPGLKGSDEAKTFLMNRGFSSYTMTEMSVDPEPDMSVELDQKLSAVDDMFLIDNYVFDYADCLDQIEVTGVVEPRTLTLDDLKALPQQTRRVTEECVLNDVNGLLACNVEVTGPTLASVVDACGGLPEGVNGFVANCYDGWSKTYQADREFLEDTILAIQFNGEDIPDVHGAPAVIVLPATIGGMWNKHIAVLDFQAFDEAPFDARTLWFQGDLPYESTTTYNLVNAAWFAGDGLEFSMADGVDLTGFAYGWSYFGNLNTISFSTDMGVTWQTYDIPADFDPDQWTTFELKWNPPAPGTYIVKVKATNDAGIEMKDPGCASIIVKVTE